MFCHDLRQLLSRCALVATAGALCLQPAFGAVYTWTGGGADANWTTGENWDGGVAPAGVSTDQIRLAGSTGLAPVVDTNEPWVLNDLVFNAGAGAFTLSGNTLRFAGSASTIILNSSSQTQTITNPVALNASRTVTATSGHLVFSGPINLGSSSMTFRGGRNVTIDGLVTGTGGLSRTDNGTVFINNDDNSFSGNISISHGVFEFATIADAGVACALGRGSIIGLGQGTWGPSDTGTIRYTGGDASTNRTMQMRSNAQSGGTSNPNYDVPSGRPTIEVTNPDTTLTFTGNFVYSSGSHTGRYWRLTGAGNGVIQGNILTTGAGILKDGGGTWTLAGNNTYEGVTTISAGTLALSHDVSSNPVADSPLIDIHSDAFLDVTGLTGPDGFVLADGQTLQGGGTLIGSLRAAAGVTVAPGTSPGTLTVQGDFTQDPGATLQIEIAGTGLGGTDYDLLDVHGDAALAGWLDIVLADPFEAELRDYFDVLTTTGSLDIAGLTVTGHPPNPVFGWWDVSVLGGADGATLRLTAVPEPGAWLMLLCALACGLLVRRR